MKVDAFDSGLAVYQGNDYPAVFSGFLLFYDYYITIIDSAVDHGAALYFKSDIFSPPEHLFGNIDVFLDFIHLEGAPRGHGSDKGNGDAFFPEIDQLEGSFLVKTALRYVSLFLQGFYVVKNRADRLESEVGLYLFICRRNVMGIDVAFDEPINSFLLFS